MQSISQIHVDSSARSSGTSSDFQIQLQPNLIIPKAHRISVGTITIPRTYYNISSYVNEFRFEDQGAGHTISLDEGNYTLSTFLSELETSMNAVSGRTHTAAVDGNTGKVTFTTNGTGMDVDFDFSAKTRLLAPLLGFTEANFSGTSIEAPNVAEFGGYKNLFIRCPQVHFPDFYTGFSGSSITRSSDILAHVPVTAEFGDLIKKEAQLEIFGGFVGGNLSISQLRVQLLNYLGDVIELNGANWSFDIYITSARLDNGNIGY